MRNHLSLSTVFVIAAFTLIAALAPGCKLFQGACTKALPAITLATTYTGDAAAALEQAERYAAGLPLSAEVKAKLAIAFDDARKGLRVAQDVLAGATDACQQVDVVDVFAAFVTAWRNVREVLGTTAPNIASMPVGGYPFRDPVVYELALRRGR